MSTMVLDTRLNLDAFARRALGMAVRSWFTVAVAGQLVFAFAVGVFYSRSAAQGHFKAWNNFMSQGYIQGDPVGNAVVAVHVVSAVIVTLAGAMQLVPRIRARAPSYHRWNGRIYVVTAFAISLAGLYMTWLRPTMGDVSQHLGASLNGALIMLCAVMAWRHAIARNFAVHRRWALRLFLVVSASWFFRIGFMLWVMLNRGPVGFDPKTFQGPALTIFSFAQYLLPLAILELYLRAQDRGGAPARIAMAGGLAVLTLATAAGIVGATMAFWLPEIRGGGFHL